MSIPKISGPLNRRQLLHHTSAVIAAPLIIGNAAAAVKGNQPVTPKNLNGGQMLSGAKFYVGIDNKGLWPNLSRLKNGHIAAAVERSSHAGGSDGIGIVLGGLRGVVAENDACSSIERCIFFLVEHGWQR